MVFLLDDNKISFPDPHYGDPDGLFAIGGDLSEERLLLAYSHGIFPWFPFRNNEPIQWFCPLRRFVIFPNEIHISHSMRTLIRKQKYHFSFNKDFSGVIHACSRLRYDEEGAWLGEDMIQAYTRLHEKRFAASVEVWDQDEKLVGGLYGVCMRNVFIGESMFSLVPSGSKLALILLAQRMAQNEGTLIDCQLETPHLRSMGGRFISYEEYMEILSK